MPNDEMVDGEQALAVPVVDQRRDVEIADALPVRLQTLDMARHVAIAPNGKRYVVATFDDTHLSRSYITAIYPQQGNYLTLIKLVLSQFPSKTPDQAIQKHVELVKAIQQGKLNGLLQST